VQQKNLKKFLPCEQRFDTIVCFLNYIVLLSALVKSLARWLLKTFVSLMCRIWRFMKIEGKCSPRQLQRTHQIHSSVNDPLLLGIHQSPLCPQHHGPATLHLPHYSRGTVTDTKLDEFVLSPVSSHSKSSYFCPFTCYASCMLCIGQLTSHLL
jgi:hypothetical protein